MGIRVEHMPNLRTYGEAIAKASEQAESAKRAENYAQYLRQAQDANRQYQLGLGGLGVQQGQLADTQQRTGLESRRLDLQEFMNNLQQDRLNWEKELGKNKQYIALLGAQAQQWNAMSNAHRAAMSGGYGSAYLS